VKIDLHAHIYPKAYLDAVSGLRERDAAFARRTPMVPGALGDARFWSVERRLADLERVGVDVQVLSLSIPNAYLPDEGASVALCQMANDMFLEMARAHPTRFRVFPSVPLHLPDAALRELARVGDAPEVVGVVLGANANGLPLNHPEFLPFYAELERRGLPLFIHPMCPPGIEAMQEFSLAPMAGFLFDSTLAALRLVFAGVFERHPRLTLIMPHLGAFVPYMLGRVEHVYEASAPLQAGLPAPPIDYFRRFYYDTVSQSVPALRMACELFGPDHIVFGTDFPFWDNVDRLARDVEALGLPPEAQEAIFSGNARRVLTRLAVP
jgi:aminocarboxymuconate-semialdehyde decarboxylase